MRSSTAKPTIMIVFNDMSLGGIQRKTLDIIRYLQQHHRCKIVICLRYQKGIFLKKIPKNVTVIGPSFHTPRFDMFWFIFWLGNKINHYRPQTILSYMDMGAVPTIVATKFLPWLKTKIVIGEDILTSKYIYTENYPSIRKYLIKLLYPFAQKVLVQTPIQKQDLINMIGSTISPKITVSPNWLSLDYPPLYCHHQRLTDILFIGRIDDQKNLPKFVNIIHRVSKDAPAIKVKIVGDGSRINQIKQLVRKLHLDQNIKFVPTTLHPEKFYLDAKVFLLTSDYEGFPLTLMEAISCGCYPVINNLPEIRGFFDKNTSQYIFDEPDQAVKIIKKVLSRKQPSSLRYYQQKLISLQSLHVSNFVRHLVKQR